MTPKEPDIYVERCSECPAFSSIGVEFAVLCQIKGKAIMWQKHRRFPKSCPLLKAPITIAAVRRTIR